MVYAVWAWYAEYVVWVNRPAYQLSTPQTVLLVTVSLDTVAPATNNAVTSQRRGEGEPRRLENRIMPTDLSRKAMEKRLSELSTQGLAALLDEAVGLLRETNVLAALGLATGKQDTDGFRAIVSMGRIAMLAASALLEEKQRRENPPKLKLDLTKLAPNQG